MKTRNSWYIISLYPIALFVAITLMIQYLFTNAIQANRRRFWIGLWGMVGLVVVGFIFFAPFSHHLPLKVRRRLYDLKSFRFCR